jgi:LPS export ABC transporter protein LptC
MNKLFAASLLLFLVLFSCKNKQSEIQDIVTKNMLKQDKAEQVTIIYSEGAKVKFRLYADELIRNESALPRYTDFKKGVKLEAFNDSLVVVSVLTAKFARYYEDKQNVLIRDSIIVVNKKGERLSTEELVWNQQLQRFYTQKPVSIRTATQVIYGNGLEANQDFSWYQITNIRGMVRVQKGSVPE